MRNRICTLCLLLFMVLFPLFAASVDSGKAAHVAERFMQQQQETMLRSSSLSLQLVYTAPSPLRSGTLEAAYYIYNVEGDNGFVIVSGDDRAVPILGYAVQGAFDPARMSPDMHSWLQRYQDQIEWAVAEGIAPASDITEQWQAIDSDLSSGTLRSSKLLSSANWAQNDPYNADCPTIGGQRTLTGCSATAMAILMRYHQWPTKGTGSHSYSWNGTTLSVTFDTTYDWANMPLNINSASSAQKNNIAKIMSDCGRSINSSYGVNATSATLSAVAASLKQFFKYDSGLAVKGRNTMSYNDWYSLVKSEIDADRLVYYSGQSSSGGHAFICDGYDGENYIHINWGWGSLHNGSFMIDALNGDGNDYSNSEQIIVGVKPGSDVEEPIEPGLKLVDTYGYSGMLINVENVVSGSSFKIEMGSVMNSTMTGFNGELSVGLFSADNNLKEVLIENNTRSLSVNSYFPSLTLLCNVSGEVANSDILKPITKVNGSDKWQVVTGEGSAVAQLKAKGNTVTRYPVTWTNPDNLAVSMYNYCQTNEAVKGMSYVFKINNPSEVSLVKVNGEIITPNTLDLYWIRQVQSALTIEINPVDPIAVNNISLNKTELELTVGESFTLVPSITPANATNKNVTWSSSNAKVSVVNGVVTAEETGTATITVTTEDGNKSAQCVVTVTAATVTVSSVQISETNRNIKQGESFTLTATVLPENATNKALSWSSSDRKIVTVDDDGLVTSAGDTGTATITVTTEDGGKKAECVVTVTAATVVVSSVQLSETNRNIKQGEYFILTATVLPENATNKAVSWSSSNTTVATVSNNGLVTSAGDTGTATITVTTEDGNKSDQCVVTVTATTVSVSSVQLSETNRNIKQGESFTLTATVLPENATNKAVSWKSSNTAVATVKEGVVTGGTATGTATITVTSEDENKTASCIVTVEAINIPVTGITLNQTQQTMKPGESITLLPTIAPANASDKRVSWSTSDAQIATVDADGHVSAVAVGEATISATTVDGGKSAQCLITVQADPEEPDEEKIEITPSPVGDGNSGQLIFALKIPDNVPFSGTFKLTLPEGMKLNIEACEVSDDLESILKMKIATLINNSWRFTLSKKTLRSETAKQYKAILAIAYDINSELANGNYSAAISQVDLDFDDGSDIQVDLIEIPLVVDREETSIASLTSPDVTLWIDNSHLFIESDRRERITVYSTSGKVIRIAEKREERLLITLPTSGWDIFLVKGGSGWSKMIRRR